MRTIHLLPRFLALTALTFGWNCAYAQEKELSAAPAPKFVGIGVELKPAQDALMVMSVMPFSPALRAGVRPGDRITAINGQLVSELSLDKATKVLEGKNGSHVTLTVASGGLPPVPVRVRREWIEARPGEQAALDRAEIAAARERLINAQSAEWDRQSNARIERNLDRLRGPLEMESRFMRKVGRLSDEQTKDLRAAGERRLRQSLTPNGFRGRWVRHEFVVNNGKEEIRDELNELPRLIVRAELAPVLKAISSEAAGRVEAERESLDLRRRSASIQVQLAAFDEALLITRDQRERLGRLLGARWTDVWRGHANERDVMDPIALCQTAVGAMDLFTIPDVELQAVLRPSQVATFKLVQLPTRLVSVFVQDGPAKRFVRRGLPIEEERLRLKLLLERLVDDAAAHAHLDDEQKLRFLAAGKLDLESHFNQLTALEDKSAGLIIARGNQIAGVKAPLPPVFTAADSTFQRVFHNRLSAEQRDNIAEADRERGRFHRRAVLQLLTVTLAERAWLTDEQAGRLEKELGVEFGNDDDAADLAGWRQATLRKLRQLQPETVERLLDDWQRSAAREYLTELADTALLLEIPGVP